MEKIVKLSLLEIITLNQMKLRHKKMQLDTADFTISLFKRTSQMTPDTPIEELEEIQNQLRAMINKTDEELKIIENDKNFIKNIMQRE